LRNLRIELLAGATELHPLEARELELELLDQHIARAQLRGHYIQSAVGRAQELFEALDVVRQDSCARHESL